MDCSNCGQRLPEAANYCNDCGAKVIRNRLTMKHLWSDIASGYLNLDNSVFLTFKHLLTQPESVINGYIEGLRKRYLNPVSYLGIALTLSGILLFLIQKVFKDRISYDTLNSGVSQETLQKMMDAVLDFSTFVFILYIPVFAISARLAFNRKNFVMTEQVVIFLYALAQWSILSFPISLFILVVSPDTYMKTGIPVVVSMFIYSLYVIQRIHRYDTGAFIGRGMLYLILCFFGYIGVVFAMMIALFLTGIISLSDFMPA